MARRLRESPVLSVSFVDMLCCALGGVLILLLVSMTNSEQRAKEAGNLINELELAREVGAERGDALEATMGDLHAAQGAVAAAEHDKARGASLLADALRRLGLMEKKYAQASADALNWKSAFNQADDVRKRLQGEVEVIRGQLREGREKYDAAVAGKLQAERALRQGNQDAEKLRDELKELRKQFQGVVSLNGPMKNVVFVFDTSTSLEGNNFPAHRDLLKSWVASLPFEKFAIVRFDSIVRTWPPGDDVTELVTATKATRTQALGFIDAFVADGGTELEAALRRSMKFQGVDTIVLFTDGEPSQDLRTLKSKEELDAFRARVRASYPHVVINTIAIGKEYFSENYGGFLQRIAADHGGTFLGR